MAKKGKILFIVHDVYKDGNQFPLGPGYLAGVLSKEGHNVQIFSQDVFHQSNEELATFLQDNRFDAIGMGFLAGRYRETVYPLSKIINENKGDAKFILGGHGASAIPTYILRDTKADIAFLGEGENVINSLLEKILNDESLDDQKGIAFRDRDDIRINPKQRPIQNLSELPFPEWRLFPMKKYSGGYRFSGWEKGDRTMSVITSRGCMGKCSFCYRMEDGIRFREIDDVMSELSTLNREYGINYFMFEDELFVPNKKRISSLANGLQKLGGNIKYYCQSRVELAKDKEILGILSSSGCQILNLGLESLDQGVLDRMHKRTKVSDNYVAVENVISAGIHPGLNFIWGCPGDSIKSLEDITEFLITYDTQGQLRTVRPPTPYPGCPLYYTALSEGKLTGPGDFFDKFTNSDRLTVNFTDIPEKDFYEILLSANSKLIDNYYKKIGGNIRDATKLKDQFKKLYFPTSPEDLKFRGARHYKK